MLTQVTMNRMRGFVVGSGVLGVISPVGVNHLSRVLDIAFLMGVLVMCAPGTD